MSVLLTLLQGQSQSLQISAEEAVSSSSLFLSLCDENENLPVALPAELVTDNSNGAATRDEHNDNNNNNNNNTGGGVFDPHSMVVMARTPSGWTCPAKK